MATILVIEDTVEILEMIDLVLGTFGHDVVGAPGKFEINAMITHYNPQLVLLDVLLRQNLSGREICKMIKTFRPSLPVILMSADAKLLVEYESFNADAIIEKPFDIIELKNKIESLLVA